MRRRKKIELPNHRLELTAALRDPMWPRSSAFSLGLMKQYTVCFAIAAGILSVPCGFLLAVNVINVRPFGVALFAGLLLLLWATYWVLKKRVWLAFPVSAGLAFLFWLLLAYQTVQRVIFVAENQGFERADGYGSPLAFLMGLVMEQLFFLPLSLLVVSALVALLRGQFRPQVPYEA